VTGRRTAEGEFSLGAIVNGGGPVVAGADLPVREVIGPAAPASWSARLPRAGAPPPPAWSGVLAGLSLLVAGAVVRGRVGR
jgi:hypothetical protein